MFGFGKNKSEKDKLIAQYEKLLAEAHRLSTIDRKAADLKTAEAEKLWKKIEEIK
ncbi:MAG: hypothetical protein ACI959_002048 [Limisphaerales bacterium]|jgi:hypothetical protein